MQGHSDEVTASHKQRTIQTSAQFLLPYLKPSFKLLDIGCGPGTITTGFSSLLSSGTVTGIDLADDIINQNKSNFPTAEYPNLTFETGNVLEGLRYEDESFDVVYTHQTILHLPDPVKAMREARRVLKTGGMLAMRESDHPDWYPEYPAFQKWKDALDTMVRSTGASGFGGGRKLHVWAREAGFDRSKMVVTGSANVFSSEEQRRWFAGVHIGRMRSEGHAEKLKMSKEDVEAIVKDFEKWRDDVDGWMTIWDCEVIAYK